MTSIYSFELFLNTCCKFNYTFKYAGVYGSIVINFETVSTITLYTIERGQPLQSVSKWFIVQSTCIDLRLHLSFTINFQITSSII